MPGRSGSNLSPTKPPTAVAACDLALLDPPYHTDVAAPALTALAERGWLAAGALCVVEVALRQHFAAPPGFTARGERASGAARLVFLDLG